MSCVLLLAVLQVSATELDAREAAALVERAEGCEAARILVTEELRKREGRLRALDAEVMAGLAPGASQEIRARGQQAFIRLLDELAMVKVFERRCPRDQIDLLSVAGRLGLRSVTRGETVADQALGDSRREITLTVLSNTRRALQVYLAQHEELPGAEQGLAVLVQEGILAKDPRDAWGRAILYERLDRERFRLRSLGRDGVEGGAGEDEDLEAASN